MPANWSAVGNCRILPVFNRFMFLPENASGLFCVSSTSICSRLTFAGLVAVAILFSVSPLFTGP